MRVYRFVDTDVHRIQKRIADPRIGDTSGCEPPKRRSSVRAILVCNG